MPQYFLRNHHSACMFDDSAIDALRDAILSRRVGCREFEFDAMIVEPFANVLVYKFRPIIDAQYAHLGINLRIEKAVILLQFLGHNL